MEERRLRVYIAGPMTNGSGRCYDIGKIHVAIAAHFCLIKAGFVPHCPHLTVFAEFMFPNILTYEEWLTLDRDYIDDCDVVLRLEGDSVGADRECNYATSIGKTVVYGLGDFLLQYKEALV